MRRVGRIAERTHCAVGSPGACVPAFMGSRSCRRRRLASIRVSVRAPLKADEVLRRVAIAHHQCPSIIIIVPHTRKRRGAHVQTTRTLKLSVLKLLSAWSSNFWDAAWASSAQSAIKSTASWSVQTSQSCFHGAPESRNRSASTAVCKEEFGSSRRAVRRTHAVTGDDEEIVVRTESGLGRVG